MVARDGWQTEAPVALEGVEPAPARRPVADEWSGRAAASEHAGNVRMSKALGWFSLALGLAELAAPRGVARLIGVKDDAENRRLLQTLGLRELATGIVILARPAGPAGMWARVGGDMMDLTLLGSALKSERADRRRVTAATAAVLGVTALDLLTGQRLGGGNGREQRAADEAEAARGVRVRRSVTVLRSPEEIYRFWRDFRNLPRFMQHLESVETLSDTRSRWRATAPVGTTVEWEAEIIEDRPGEGISWRSLPGSEVDNIGTVRFVPAPGGRGTEIHVELRYDPPGGRLGSIVAKLFGQAPEQQVATDLRRLKQVLETGEVVHSDASIHRGMHPARPAEAGELADVSR
jgi:uncharacterized membrane protein